MRDGDGYMRGSDARIDRKKEKIFVFVRRRRVSEKERRSGLGVYQ